jgi:hypothetical protein
MGGSQRIFLSTLAALALWGLAAPAPAAVTLKDSGEQPVARKNADRTDWVQRQITLSNDKARYTIRYERYKDKSGQPGGDASIAAVQVDHLYTAPWLAFNVTAPQGLTLARRDFEVEPLTGQLDRKGVAIRWAGTPKVELRLILLEKESPLYGRLSVEGGGKYTVIFNTAPGGYCPTPQSRDRWVLIEEKDQQHNNQPAPLKAAGSLFLYDKTLDPAANSHGHGAAGWSWSAAEAAKVQFTCGEYTSALRIDQPAEAQPLRFALRSFLNVPNAEARSDFTRHAPETLKRLMTDENLFEVAKKITIPKPGTSNNP